MDIPVVDSLVLVVLPDNLLALLDTLVLQLDNLDLLVDSLADSPAAVVHPDTVLVAAVGSPDNLPTDPDTGMTL